MRATRITSRRPPPPPPGEVPEGTLDVLGAVPLVEVVRGLGEAGHGIGISLRAEGDTEVIPRARTGRGLDGTCARGDRRDFRFHHLDAEIGEVGERSLALAAVGALTRHHPELRQAGREALLSLDHHDAVVVRRQPPQLRREGEPANPSAEHQCCCVGQARLLSEAHNPIRLFGQPHEVVHGGHRTEGARVHLAQAQAGTAAQRDAAQLIEPDEQRLDVEALASHLLDVDGLPE